MHEITLVPSGEGVGPRLPVKRCRKCGEIKPWSHFHRHRKNQTDGRRGRCKPCVAADERALHAERPELRRNRRLKHRYGITSADYQVLLERQGGTCATCQRREGDVQWGVLCVDHDHATGKVRGLLCNSCNTAAGYIEAAGTDLQALAKYLTKEQ